MRRLFYSAAAMALVSVFACVIVIMQAYASLREPLGIEADTTVVVNSGDSISSLSRRFEAENILSSPLYFRVYARLSDKTAIKAGEYLLQPNDNALTLLQKLNVGDVIHYPLTIVEGWTFRDALAYIQVREKITVTLDTQEKLNAFLAELNLDNNHPEGWFFPDTYHFSATTTDREILNTAYSRMRDTLATEWENREGELPYTNAYEALIMASIVEKETGLASEREQIAGVFVRRLQKNMRLQTDPTVIYGMGERYQGNIRRRDLQEATPYNTYVINGLPPTPIALPGREAIAAALHPDAGTALYFVAKGDGSHQFSDTVEEHNAAVQQYQLQRRAGYRSSPPPRADSGDGP